MMRFFRSIFILLFFSVSMPGPAAGQRVNSLPGLYPSSVTAYDLEEGMPISCVKDGWVDQKGRLWVNACTSQPEHRTVNFFQFDGRRSEIIHLGGAPPEAEGQLAVEGIGDTGELYGFFRGSEHFFYFDPDTRSTRFFRLGQADAAIYFMEESPAYGLIIMAASGETQWIYRLAGESVEQLLEYPVAKACSEAVRYHDVQLQFQTITGEDVWFLPAPESYCTPTAIRKQFRLFRFSLRNHTLQEYTYGELFSEAPAPGAFVRNEFLLSSGHKGQLFLLVKNHFYKIDSGTGKANLLQLLIPNPIENNVIASTQYRIQKDDTGNLLFLLPRRTIPHYSLLLDTLGQFYNYSAVLETASANSRYPNLPSNQVLSADFRRGLLAFHIGGLIAVDLQFNDAISTHLQGRATRAISEWRPGAYLVRSQPSPLIWEVRPLSTSTANLFINMGEVLPEVKFSSEASLEKTEDGFWWYATNNSGLIRMDSSRDLRIFPFHLPLRRFIFLDSKTAALAGKDQLVHLFRLPDGKIEVWKGREGTVQIKGRVNDLYLSKDSTLWIASLQGLWEIGLKDGRSRRIGHREGFLDERMMSIHEDSKGRLWIGTYGNGLHIYEPGVGVVKVITNQHGLSNNTVIGILADDENVHWISTYKGLNLVSEEGEVLAQLFEEDGLSTNEFNRYSYFKDSEGRLLFGSIKGINIIEPKRLKEQLRPADTLRIYLSKLTRYNPQSGSDSTQYFGFDRLGEIRLPATHRYLDLEFALSSLLRQEDQKFAYKIEPHDQPGSAEWIFIRNESQLYLSNLSPGLYNISIRGSDYRGNWTDSPIVLRVRVGRFFYQQTWFYLLCFLFFVGTAFSWFYRQRQLRRQLEAELAERTEEIMAARGQLIVQEKLASLGQMSAGIAHEIKNPLNFINNFALGSKELLEEMNREFSNENMDNGALLRQNMSSYLEMLQKYNQNIFKHGSRIDEIIAGMMDHARAASEKRLASDLNKLVESNLKMAYHGFQSRYSNFGITINRDYCTPGPVINIFPNELGRCLLNILDNACYAVYQKNKMNGSAYEPAIRVTTTSRPDWVEVRIKDNGTGIPKAVQGEIFHPFFTTKPPGTGNVGLGLSICHDIITQRHEGQLTMESEEGEFTTFVIALPV